MKVRLLLLCCSLALGGCKPPVITVVPPASPSPSPSVAPTPTPSPTPPPVPTPTPVPTLPRKPVEMGRMFNGVTFRTKFSTPASEQLASVERVDDKSYEVEISFTAKLPRASTSLEDLASNDPKLPHVLNQMAALVENSKVSPFFDKLYENKVSTLRDQLFALDQVVSRHNFYDCETILEMKNPVTNRKALMIIGDMDVNVDGSDGDRNFEIDDSGRFFQPQTSYRWPKTTNRVNPLIPKSQARIATLKDELAGSGVSAARKKEIQDGIQHLTRTINDLKSSSFLISAADPTIVVPGFMLRDKSPYAPAIGDYAVVIYDGVIYPTIVGDAGPSYKVGESSLRLSKQINPKASAISRPVSNIRVAYLVFPGTADKASQPDLAKWREKCQHLIDEIGGAAPELFTWEDIIPPWPTPTPSPTPTPTPSPTPTPTPSPTPTPTPSATPEPGSTASPSPAPSSEITPPPIAPEVSGGASVASPTPASPPTQATPTEGVSPEPAIIVPQSTPSPSPTL